MPLLFWGIIHDKKGKANAMRYKRKQIKLPLRVAFSINLPLVLGEVQINDFLKDNKTLCDYLKEQNIKLLPYMSATYDKKTHILSYIEKVVK